jgi:hypothetical protein
MPSKRDYKRPLTVLVLILFVVAHSIFPSRIGLDWPTVALFGIALFLWVAPQLEFLLPFVKKFKIGEAEIELREQATALAESVVKSEESTPQVSANDTSARRVDDGYKRLVNTSVEAHILDLAVRDRQAALMRLAIEIEKEILILHGTLGLRNQFKAGNFREIVDHLRLHGAIGEEMRNGLMEFWKVRNQIAHSHLSDESILTSTLDSGIRLLRLIKAIPRPRYTVVNPRVAVFKDQECKEQIRECDGVIIESTDPAGSKRRQIFPAGREFAVGEIVGWDWDLRKQFGVAYYRNPESGVPTEAWTSSCAFVGQSQPPAERA